MQRRYTRNAGRRPGKQWLPAAVTPLRLNVQTPITPPGQTVVQIVASEYGCRVTPEANEEGNIVLSAWWDGTWQHKEPISIIYDGEDGEGSLIKVTFDGEFDTGKLWELRIIAGWKVVESRKGGIPGGLLSLAVGQPTSVGGWLVISSAEEGGGNAPPPVYWVSEAQAQLDGSVALTIQGYSGSPQVDDWIPPITFSGNLATASIITAATWNLTFPLPVVAGDVIDGPNVLVGDTLDSAGAYLGPFTQRAI